MRTRTLLLLAVTCGLAILVAGTIQLLRLVGQEAATILEVGDPGRAGDAVVVVTDFSERDEVAVVTVRLSGVDDPRGLEGFALAGVSKVSVPLPGEGAQACREFTVAEAECTLSFSTEGFEGRSRQLLFRRAEEQVRWKLK
jgi:hypothetical protein